MDNCEPDLSFSKYVELDCFRWLYMYGHICDFLSRYAQLKEYILLQSEQPGDWHQMKTTGPREQDWSCDEVIKTPGSKGLEHLNLNTVWTDEYLQVVMTSQNVDLQELQILLKGGVGWVGWGGVGGGGGGGGGGVGGGFKLILAINTSSIFCEIRIRWTPHLTGH